MQLVASEPRTGESETAATPTVRIAGGDPLTRAGIAAFLDGHARLVPEGGAPPGRCDVVLAVVEAVDERTSAFVRSLSAVPGGQLLLLVGGLDADGVARAVQLGALGVLRRDCLGAATLTRAVTAVARGEAVVPSDLLGQLIGQAREGRTSRSGPPALSVVRLSERERAVLQRLADGADTREIARALSYSERTVKTVIQDLTRRFGLRNRPHVVAYALRHGLI